MAARTSHFPCPRPPTPPPASGSQPNANRDPATSYRCVPRNGVASDDTLLRSLRHPQLLWNTPLSPSRADRLLDLLEIPAGARIVDLGCGWGKLLVRAVARAPGSSGEGIDLSGLHIERARSLAVQRGLNDRVVFHEADLTQFVGPADRLICIGADHAWGGPGLALSNLASAAVQGGRLLFGSGFWERPPGQELVEMLGPLPSSLDGMLAGVKASGWTLVAQEVADRAEWDEFEARWREELHLLARAEPASPRGQQAARIARERRESYEQGYRGVLGFAYLILAKQDG
jgi:SAM-dependent methyltransferase